MARPLKSVVPLRCVAVSTSPSAEEAVSAVVEAVTGVVPGVHVDLASGTTTVAAYREVADGDVAPLRSRLRDALEELRGHGLDIGPATVVLRKVPARDWAESWKRHFKPMEVGARLLVKPTWSRRRARSGQAVLLLDPGLSFGTGQHATTRFCLAEVVRLHEPGRPKSLMDAGMGSGILALAAAAVGYGHVEGFDFDPDCVRIARENAVLNGLESRVTLGEADVTRLPRRAARVFDVVCANLMHDLLVAEASRIAARVAKGGRLVLAGILVQQFPAVEAAYRAQGWAVERDATEGEWRSATLARATAA